MDVNLPQDFKLDMEKLLGSEAHALFNEYRKPPYKGLRVNTLKCSTKKLEGLMPGELKKNPFSPCGYYLSSDYQGIGNSPLHHAGAFYVQEPSAMSAVTLLGVNKNDKVLDLCAAPGGKSTQIAAALNGTGLLWSNEIIKSRANILLSNIERCGVKNAVVSNESPNRLCDALQGYFDKVLVDAPCSGEGMFRKNPGAISEWSRANVLNCKERQLQILDCAAKAIKQGGELVYSTCTFSHEENEEVIDEFLKTHPEFTAVESFKSFGRKTENGGVRIFPMDGGEGHYAVKLVRIGKNQCAVPEYNYFESQNEVRQLKSKIQQMESDIYSAYNSDILLVNKDKILIPPKTMPRLKGLNILRAGVVFAEIKNNRLEPHHSLFMSMKMSEVKSCVSYPLKSSEISAFLRGEELPSPIERRGYCLVAVEGISVGFAKAANGRLKNKYPKGLRNR